ncbi:hypothetical protein P9112_014286 [Eukaryota sp. TZLM1-RC]
MMQKNAVLTIERAFLQYSDRTIFRFYHNLLSKVNDIDPRQILRSIHPSEAKLIERFMHVRFRLSGNSFPPMLVYKIFVNSNVADINSFAPRDYHQSNERLPAELADRSHWYHRNDDSLNPWRPVSESSLAQLIGIASLEAPVAVLPPKPKPSWHWSKLKRRQDVQQRRISRRIEWLRKTYNGSRISEDTEDLFEFVENLDFDDYIEQWENLAISAN